MARSMSFSIRFRYKPCGSHLMNVIRLTVAWIALLFLTGLASAAKAPVANAAESGDSEAVRTLLKQKGDVNAPQVDGMTALHWATYHDDLDTVKLLLAAGADAK